MDVWSSFRPAVDFDICVETGLSFLDIVSSYSVCHISNTTSQIITHYKKKELKKQYKWGVIMGVTQPPLRFKSNSFKSQCEFELNEGVHLHLRLKLIE